MAGKTDLKSRPTVKEVKKGVRTTSPGRAVTKKSPAQSKSKPETKSPARRKSPGRPKKDVESTRANIPRGRSRSIERSPSRIQPNRSVAIKPKSTSTPKSPGTPPRVRNFPRKATEKSKQIPTTDDDDSDSDVISIHSTASSKLPIHKKEGSIESINNVIRRAPKAQEVDRVVHLKSNYEPISKLTEFSDEDDFEIKKRDDIHTDQKKTDEYSVFGALIHIFIVVGIFFGILIFCNDIDCAFKIPNLTRFTYLKTYFDLSVLLSYTAYFLFIAILSVLPFGGRKRSIIMPKAGRMVFNLNGFFSAIVVLVVLGILEFYNFRPAHFIHDNFFKLAISGFILALPVALMLFIKSTYDQYIFPKQNKLINFFYGTQTAPRLFGVLDIKLVLFRTCGISLIVMATICIFLSLGFSSLQQKDIGRFNLKSLNFNPTVLTLSILQLVYLLDAFIFEHTMLTTMEMQQETIGYIKCLEYCSFFSLYTLIPKYVYDFDVQLETWKLVACTVLFLIGYILYRGSNTQKHNFRENPYSPRIAHLESIPTSTGKKLICSGFWGIVRHPNYLGDILMQLSFLPFVLYNPPCIIIYFIIIGLVQRAYKDNKQCRQRYGPSWERYCQRVKYILIPKVL